MTGMIRRGFMIGTLLVLVSASLLASGCNFLPSEEEQLAPPLMKPVAVDYKTQAVTRGTLVKQVTLEGSFYPRSRKSVSFENQSGRLKSLVVELGQIVKAGATIAELDPGSLPTDIRIQELEIEKSQLTLSQLQSSGADTYSVQRARIDLEEQRIHLDVLNGELKSLRIVAPFTGPVVYLTSVAVGMSVGPGETVAILADTSQLLLLASGGQTSSLPIGAQVTVTFGGKDLAGEVVANPSTLKDDPDTNLRSAAIIQFKDGTPENATMGKTARIVYVMDRRENVLTLPLNRIHTWSGQQFVYVLVDGIRVEKGISIGMTTDTEAEIVNGLSEGDLVIIG